jgi:putative ABC transport system permease protein
MKYFKIAFRNLNRQKRRTIILAIALGFGILVITLINGFTTGVVKNVETNISQLMAGHIFISGKMLSPSGREISIIRDDDAIQSAIDTVNKENKNVVRSFTRRSNFNGTLINGNRTIMQEVQGIDWEKEKTFRDHLVLTGGSLDSVREKQMIIIPSPVAERLNVKVGESILAKVNTVSGQQNVGEFIVGGISVDTGLFGAMSSYARIDYVNELIDVEQGKYQRLNITLASINDVDSFGDKLFTELSKSLALFARTSQGTTASSNGTSGTNGSTANSSRSRGGMGGFMFGGGLSDVVEKWDGVKYDMRTINETLSQFKSIVGIVNFVGLIIFLILLFITMVGIVNTFRMIMLERIREIGTMRAIGVQRGGIRAIFLLEAFLLATLGVVCGFIFAQLTAIIVGLFSFSSKSPVYFFLDKGRFTFNFLPVQVISNYVIVAVLSLLAALIPAQKASKLDPAAALRTQK